MNKLSKIAPFFSIILLFALWWIGTWFVGEESLPSPGSVLAIIINEASNGELFYHTGVTLWRVVTSFILSMVIGITIGVCMGYFKTVDMIFDPWLLFFLNLPALVIIILAYIWMGLTEIAVIIAVSINKIPNVVVTIREGAKAMDKDLQQMASVFHFSRWKRLRHVIFPELGPYIAAAMRSGISLIWKIVLVAELLGRSNGIGFQLHLQFQLFDIAAVMAWGLTFIVIMQLVELFITRPFESYVNRWRK